MLLTIFPVEADFSLVLLLALQGLVQLLDDALVGLRSVEEAAGAGLLHHFGPREAGQLTKPIGAVHDGIAVATLSIPQKEVAICKRETQVGGKPALGVLRVSDLLDVTRKTPDEDGVAASRRPFITGISYGTGRRLHCPGAPQHPLKEDLKENLKPLLGLTSHSSPML
ncbi:hypothetical protein EYF80_037009 [Liparis tanakae]|uniref:Uncharacterized protein n=1 Tax=Liparis tanakae TaxID=230148 RepID=A0A4Z2GH12_9TELE|nr:hypothetical protein EYF80_037009 [Liparis tanakae]